MPEMCPRYARLTCFVAARLLLRPPPGALDAELAELAAAGGAGARRADETRLSGAEK